MYQIILKANYYERKNFFSVFLKITSIFLIINKLDSNWFIINDTISKANLNLLNFYQIIKRYIVICRNKKNEMKINKKKKKGSSNKRYEKSFLIYLFTDTRQNFLSTHRI